MTIAVSFILGVAVGAVLGFLLPSGAQFWIGRKEWKEASRELELADRLLETLREADDPYSAFEDGISRDDANHGNRPAIGRPAPRPG